ncbi:DVUA0089 family protein [Paludisphaera soli]|uniref:DVUA0089 family protein n=1 Tax=Paludisphaera soli TaxID=2712865 RepID=UPI0013EDC872|nr:DVUA0089 family protein [Paludisphaera soli]
MPSPHHRNRSSRRRNFRPWSERLEARALLAVDLDDQLSEAVLLGPVASSRSVAGTISEAADVDMYAFEVQAGQVVEFDIDTPTNGVPGLGSYIRIFDANGTQLAANNDAQAPDEPQPPSGASHVSTFFDSYVRRTFGTAGVYYIGVSNWENTQYSAAEGEADFVGSQHLTGPYTLTISAVHPNVYIDRGADGLWGWTVGVGVAPLNSGNPEAMAVAQDGTLFVDFGPNGLWTRTGAGFVQINPANPQNMAVAVDGSLYLDYGPFGLWRLTASGLGIINGANPENMVPAADGSLYVDYGTFGLWRLTASGLRIVNGANPENMVPAADGSLFIDYGQFGLWRMTAGGGSISQISVANPEGLTAAPDGTLFVDYGPFGLWTWIAGSITRISSGNPEGFDVGRDGFLYVDFGRFGILRRSPTGSFVLIVTEDPEALAG